MNNDTTTCDACGEHYTFTSYKDRCPVCCPDQLRDGASDNHEQPDEEEPMLEYNFIHDGKSYR